MAEGKQFSEKKVEQDMQLPKLQAFPLTVTENMLKQLPKMPRYLPFPSNITRPPQPILTIEVPRNSNNAEDKIIITVLWRFQEGCNPVNIKRYELYQFHKKNNGVKTVPFSWKKVGDIQALSLPMACSLCYRNMFDKGCKYYFVVRAVYKDNVMGDFSYPAGVNILSV